MWKTAPLKQGLKDNKGFHFVSLLLLGLLALRPVLSLVKHTSKLDIANHFHPKYCSVNRKVKYDLFLCLHMSSTQQMIKREHVTRDR